MQKCTTITAFNKLLKFQFKKAFEMFKFYLKCTPKFIDNNPFERERG